MTSLAIVSSCLFAPVVGLFTGAPGLPELIILLVVLLILFGNRLPSVMRSLGQGITEFKKGVREERSDAAKIEDSSDK